MKKIVIGILAHVDSGKTTLSEAMLYCSGSIGRLGRVDHGDTFLDTFSLERSRGITIFSKQAELSYQDVSFTLLDTPGHVDFSAETERTLRVLDYAILVVSGTDGVQGHTATLWKLLHKYHVPCFVFVNKMDQSGADRDMLTAHLKEKLSDRCVAFGGEEDNDFYENIALCDESLLEQYDAAGKVDHAAIVDAIRRRRIFPCYFGAALRLSGVEEFLRGLCDYTAMPEYGGDFAARVYKVSQDSRGVRLTHLKVTGGKLKVRDLVRLHTADTEEKISQIRVYSGEKFIAVDEAPAGTVCAVTGLSTARPGDGLGAEENAALPVLEPVLTYQVILPEGADAHVILQNLRVLEAEDPTLNVVWNERLSEIQVQLMGEIQLEVLQSIFAERFGAQIRFGKGNIIYKETIADTVEGVGHFEPLRHYAEVHLLLQPLPRDSGLVFDTSCREDDLDKNWQRLILTHLYEKTHLGVLAGAPITDIKITLAAGRAHAKHTEGGDFRQATYRAVRQGLRCANSVLLEPVYDYTLEVPSENVGRALADIQRMHGSFEPPVASGDCSVITGSAPVATIGEYSREVAQYTHGRGKLSCTLKGYDHCHNADEVIAAAGYDPDRDTDNPCDSVFCSHGAGHTVPWDEVKQHMHLPSVLDAPKETPQDGRRILQRYQSQKDIFALDKELMRIFEQTYGPVRPRSAPAAARRYQAPTAPSRPKASKAAPVDTTEYVLVDGYNVIFDWDYLRHLSERTIEGARNALINILCNYQGYRKCELILVFDAYRVPGSREEIERVDGISIVYTKEAETADTYIERVSHQLARKQRVRVVTSDRLEQLIIIGNGALRVSSAEFYDEVSGVEDEIRAIISQTYT